MQRPKPASILPSGHSQEPLLHSLPPKHMVPQLPQSLVLVDRSVHEPSQSCSFAGQVGGGVVQVPEPSSTLSSLHAQTPVWQVLPPVHFTPQFPQSVFVVRSVQTPSQVAFGAEHVGGGGVVDVHLISQHTSCQNFVFEADEAVNFMPLIV